MLHISEIYRSIQGETSFAGLPCTFIRLSGCDLRCSYCDTEYAFNGGTKTSIDDVVSQAIDLDTQLITVTGGEPLIQEDVFSLITKFIERGKTVAVETSGAHSIKQIDDRAVVILDFKCPSSGEVDRNLFDNVSLLKSTDEVKFVIATDQDYKWACSTLNEHDLTNKANVIFSWANPPEPSEVLKPFPSDSERLKIDELGDRIVRDKLFVRFIPQLHKVIWTKSSSSK